MSLRVASPPLERRGSLHGAPIVLRPGAHAGRQSVDVGQKFDVASNSDVFFLYIQQGFVRDDPNAMTYLRDSSQNFAVSVRFQGLGWNYALREFLELAGKRVLAALPTAAGAANVKWKTPQQDQLRNCANKELAGGMTTIVSSLTSREDANALGISIPVLIKIALDADDDGNFKVDGASYKYERVVGGPATITPVYS